MMAEYLHRWCPACRRMQLRGPVADGRPTCAACGACTCDGCRDGGPHADPGDNSTADYYAAMAAADRRDRRRRRSLGWRAVGCI